LGGWIFFQNIVKLLIRINAPTFLAHIDEHQSLFDASEPMAMSPPLLALIWAANRD
jgi:hypothetical protein